MAESKELLVTRTNLLGHGRKPGVKSLRTSAVHLIDTALYKPPLPGWESPFVQLLDQQRSGENTVTDVDFVPHAADETRTQIVRGIPGDHNEFASREPDSARHSRADSGSKRPFSSHPQQFCNLQASRLLSEIPSRNALIQTIIGRHQVEQLRSSTNLMGREHLRQRANRLLVYIRLFFAHFSHMLRQNKFDVRLVADTIAAR